MDEQKQDIQLELTYNSFVEVIPGAIDDREGWQERVREIRADGTTWW